MKIKHLLSLIAIMLLIFALASCTGDPAETTPTTDGTDAPATQTDLILLENGEFKFKIIRPEHADKDIVSAAVALREELKKITNAEVTISDDFIKKGEEHDPNACEILFGLTNYEESTKLHNGISYGQYRIAVEGNKIVIAALDGSSASKAAMSFAYYVESLIADGKAILPATYSSHITTDPIMANIPAFVAGKYNTSYSGTYNEKCYIYKSTTKEDFYAYVDLAVKNGCILHDTAEMGNNLSAILKTDKALITVFFSGADKYTRVIIDDIKTTSLTVTEAENQYEKVCDSVLVQLGLEQPYDGGAVFTSAVANYNNGMGYIFRLHDGSFIIIDGGFNKVQGAKMIYEKLYELAPDKNNIVIAAWIMSHQHGDHVGAYRKFTEAYSKRVKLERVIYNMPSSSELSSVNESTSNAGMVNQYVSNYSGAVSSIAHPGHVHYIRNAKIEVLHSIDLLRPSTSFVGGNSFCIAVKITIEGQTFLFAGDSHTDMTAKLIKTYGSYLKSDFCQVVHHGATGASTEFYKAVDPTVVIWPLGTWDYYPWRRYETFNTYLFESPNVKEIILAGHTDRTITLPYTFPTEKVLPEEIEVTWNYLEGKN